MKIIAASLLLTICLMFSTSAMAQQGNKAADNSSSALNLDSQKAQQSYAIGMRIGENIKHDGVDVDTKILMRALNDAYSGGKLQMTDEQAQSIIMGIAQQARAKRDVELKKEGEENKKAGEAFLAANKSKPGVVTLPSGVQYKVIKQGNGPKPVATDTVECNYRGTLVDGKEFDSSFKRGQPATFPVGGVIKGWSEILQLMPVGSEYQVVIPANMAYGAHPPSVEIGPDATLIFDIQLLGIKQKPEDAKKAAPAGKSPTQSSAK